MTKLSTCFSHCKRNCCPNLCSSVQTVDDESVELLSKSALKSTSTTADLPDVEDPSITLAATVDPWGEDSVDDTLSTELPTPTSTLYGTVELSAATNGGDLPVITSNAIIICCTISLLSSQVPYSIMRYQVSTVTHNKKNIKKSLTTNDRLILHISNMVSPTYEVDVGHGTTFI